MTRFPILIALAMAASLAGFSQTKTVRKAAPPRPSSPPAAKSQPTGSVSQGTITGGVYKNSSLSFSFPLPDAWTVATPEFATYMKQKGVDISPKPPKAADPASQAKVDTNFKRLNVLLTTYRALPGSPQNSMIRVAAEDVRHLDTNRPVKDAVDYVDLMRAQLGAVRMPAGYKYSDTQAEKLGPNQFAYIDTLDNEGKTRIYVTVRKGYATLFSLNYVADDDLETFRDLLARASFALK